MAKDTLTYDEIDEKLEALLPGETMYISCPTPDCGGLGGKCATCKTIWTACDCLYNEWKCKAIIGGGFYVP